MLSFALNILNYIWHGFHVQNGLPNRFAFIYVALILTMGYDVLRDIRRIALWKILAAGILAIAFAAVSFALRLGDLGTEVYLITLALLLIYMNLLLIVRLWRRKKNAYHLPAGRCDAGGGGGPGHIRNRLQRGRDQEHLSERPGFL